MSQSTTTTERASGSADGELLAQFIALRDESSFRALVDRFGLLVWNVAMRVTRQRQDAEDAFQATFMTLARRAASIQRPAALSGWLYATAHRTSLRMRFKRRRRREQALSDELTTRENASLSENTDLLYAELSALPRKYRDPLVRRYLQGESLAQIATALDLTPIALKGR